MTETRHPQLKLATWNRLVAAHGWTTPAQAARELGMSTTSLYRVLSGQRRPGGDFIHLVMTAFPSVRYGELFEDETNEPKEAVLWASTPSGSS